MNQTTKLPFKSYTTMNISAAYTLSCPDLYRFFVLSLTTDKETLKTDTTLDQLAMFVGEKPTAYYGGKTSTSLTQRLAKSGEVNIEHIRAKSLKENKEVNRIIYTFKEVIPTKYRRISRDFVNLDLSVKLKGYLLKLFALADAHSYHINYSATAIAKDLKMAKVTVGKYNDELINRGFLSLDGSGFNLHIESFLIDMPKDQSAKVELMIQNVENVISMMNESEIQLPKSYMQYLAAKKDNFKKIRNMEYFMQFVISGVPYKSKEKEEVEYSEIYMM